MAGFLFFLLFSTFNIIAAAQQRNTNVGLGSSLTPNTNSSSWRSPSGLYAFGFFPLAKGYAVGVFLEKTMVWTARMDNPIVSADAILSLTNDGRLVLQQTRGQDIDIVSVSESITSASVLDNGNFVLYGNPDHQKVIWQSFDVPTNTLLPGQKLSAGQELFSSVSETDPSRGIFRLKMQVDGNLVQYPVNTPDTDPYAYYAAYTFGAGKNVTLNLDNNGYLYLLYGGSIIRNITTGGGYPMANTTYLMRLDVDGIFRVYSRSLNPRGGTWTVRFSSTDDKCDPKGVCGLNSFCVQMDQVPDCRCLPEFAPAEAGNRSSGCVRNFTTEGCLANDIRVLENTVWEDDSYAVLSTTTREDCMKACREDCNCEAALFKEGKCSKQRLPLRFGRRLTDDANVALIKVGEPGSGSGTRVLPSKEIKKEVRLDILASGVSLNAIAVLVMVMSVIYAYRNRTKAYKKLLPHQNVELVEDVALRAFSYAELIEATNDFQEQLGRGSSGTVYKGILRSTRKAVAVKRLEKELAQGEREFQTELKVIGRTHHRNLVRLLGYCLDGPNNNKLLLVYEYMRNGSLADVLFKPEDYHPNWDERSKIARDISRGILYLHEECETQIIHCDIKPQNILMDENTCAKISDFGLAKLLKRDQTNTITEIRGTRGYVAPEWHRKQPVTVKADVYSFGIVLLEIICRRRCVDYSVPEEEAILEEWVYSCFEQGRVCRLVGDELVDRTKLERMVKIGIWCVQDEPSLRPSMKKVLLMLEGTVDIPVPPSPASFLSAMIV